MAEIHPVTLPKWGLEMSEGAIAAWRVEEGAAVTKGAELVDIETEKILNTLEADREGVLRRKIAQVGETHPIGALIGVIAAAETLDAEIDRFIASYKPINASFEPSETAPSAPALASAENNAAEKTSQPPVASKAALSLDELKTRNAAAHASPIARKIADQLGVDLSTVRGTGKGDRISQADVEAAAAMQGAAAPQAQLAPSAPTSDPSPAPDPVAGPAARRLAREEGVDLADVAATGAKGRIQKEDVHRAAEAKRAGHASEQSSEPVVWTPMRKSIGQALSRAKQTVPHFYASIDIAMDDALSLRARLNRRPDIAARVSVNDLVVKASALALKAEPDVNVHVEEAGVRRFARADIAIAVAIDGGLLTPVIRDAGAKHIFAIGSEAASLAARARTRSLTADDLKDATFTISNLGMYGVREFDAIVSPPQAAILAIGAVRREARETPQGGVAFASVMTATLSCDHRAVDGALAGKFLSALKAALEEPLSLVL